MSAHSGPKGGYEERDVAFRAIVVTGLALVAIVVGTVILMRLLDLRLVARETARSAPASPLAAQSGREEPPSPRLQTHPRLDLTALRAREQTLLDTYGWVDRDHGRVRIPVDRAMQLLLAERKR